MFVVCPIIQQGELVVCYTIKMIEALPCINIGLIISSWKLWMVNRKLHIIRKVPIVFFAYDWTYENNFATILLKLLRQWFYIQKRVFHFGNFYYHFIKKKASLRIVEQEPVGRASVRIVKVKGHRYSSQRTHRNFPISRFKNCNCNLKKKHFGSQNKKKFFKASLRLHYICYCFLNYFSIIFG